MGAPTALVLGASFALVALAPASAACRDDLVGASQTIERTRNDLQSAAPAAKCAAFRQHIAALTQVRIVFARCDTGASKAKNAQQVSASLADMTRQMQANCRR